MQSKGLSRAYSNTTVPKHQFFGTCMKGAKSTQAESAGGKETGVKVGKETGQSRGRRRSRNSEKTPLPAGPWNSVTKKRFKRRRADEPGAISTPAPRSPGAWASWSDPETLVRRGNKSPALLHSRLIQTTLRAPTRARPGHLLCDMTNAGEAGSDSSLSGNP